jgi:hypothetical protein
MKTGEVKMAKYRKKPIVIEAIQFNGRNSADIHEFCGDKVREPVGKDYLEIETLDGIHIASPGDYIIKGIKGEFYPCKPNIFEKTYEKVANVPVYHCDICGKSEFEVGDLKTGRTQIGRDFQVCKGCIKKHNLKTNNDVGLILAERELIEYENDVGLILAERELIEYETIIEKLKLEINVYKSKNKPPKEETENEQN